MNLAAPKVARATRPDGLTLDKASDLLRVFTLIACLGSLNGFSAVPLHDFQAYLKASNTGAADQFGVRVAISGNTAVVSTRTEDSNATGVNGDAGNNGASNSGAVYVYAHDGTNWIQQAYLKASNTEANDQFGYSVAISGDTIVVGADIEASNATGIDGAQDNNLAGISGAAYVFVRNGSTWSQQAYLKASNTDVNDAFGRAVAISGDTIVVGAPVEGSNATGVNGDEVNNNANGSGAAYVFTRNGSTWTQQAYLKASNTGVDDRFGHSVAIAGDSIVVGAYGEASNATGVSGNEDNNSAGVAGAAYVFFRDRSLWTQQAYLKAANTEAGDQFGELVAIDGDSVVIGARHEDSNANTINGNDADNSASSAGAAYVFFRNGSIWSQQAYLKAANTAADDQFGFAVSISGDKVVVGAWFEDSDAIGVDGDPNNNNANDAGAAYVFKRTGSTWTQQSFLKASNTGVADLFGSSVANSGETIIVGAHGEDSNAGGVNGDVLDNSFGDSGAAYVFAGTGPFVYPSADVPKEVNDLVTVASSIALPPEA